MKLRSMLVVLALMSTVTLFAQKKSGIISFSIHGKDRGSSSMSSSGGGETTDLYFIGDNSTRLNDTLLTSDAIVRYTEAALKDMLGYELVPVNLERPATAVDQMNGSMMIMETITEKKAFTKLGYDEAIVVNARIYSGGKTGKGYKPTIEITVKVIDKGGKTTLKKSEKLKIDEKVEAKLVEYTESGGNVSLGDMLSALKKTNSDPKAGSESSQGVPSVKVLDWYKQCFSNLVLPKE
jgi:hypothetical protein